MQDERRLAARERLPCARCARRQRGRDLIVSNRHGTQHTPCTVGMGMGAQARPVRGAEEDHSYHDWRLRAQQVAAPAAPRCAT